MTSYFLKKLKKIFRGSKKSSSLEIDPDQIFIDAENLPDFDLYQFEGRLEKPISKTVERALIIFLIFVGLFFILRLFNLQITNGKVLSEKSENNRLHSTTIFADRGIIYDRNKVPLVWNTVNTATSSDFSWRQYATTTGLSTTLGYVKYPQKDQNGFYFQEKIEAKDGLERIFDDTLSGIDGKKMVETDALGNITSEGIVEPPKSGKNITISIDGKIQKALYKSMLDISEMASYKGGSAIILDIHTGEIIALSNFPEYDSTILSDGSDSLKIKKWLSDKNNPFLNRAIDGLYTPGSIVKPFIAMGVLDRKIIDPNKTILSTGSISIPNPYDPTKFSIFYDWRPQGHVDLRKALAVSSNVYFYEVGGGFEKQKGLGIYGIKQYMNMFGFGTTTGINFYGEQNGVIPDPEWKKSVFNGEVWRLGDTYNTAIGQYGMQITPIQAVRAISALANGGNLLVPTFEIGKTPIVSARISLDPSYYKIVLEGMRDSVTEGTSQAINLPFVKIASKTGTAQIGINKDQVNSWTIGFWPYDNPHYAFVVVMEKGSKNNQFGSVLVWQQFFNWLNIYDNGYLK